MASVKTKKKADKVVGGSTSSTEERGRRLPAQGKSVNGGYAAGAVLVLALGAILGALLFSSRGTTVAVWVSAVDLEAGHEIVAGDLETLVVPLNTELSGTLATTNLEGRVLALPLASGALISRSVLLEDGDTFEAGDAVVEIGIKLLPGDVPPGLSVGDEVLLVELPTQTTIETILEEPVPGRVAFMTGDIGLQSSTGIQITVAVTANYAESVGKAAGLDRLVVVVTGRG